MMHGQKNIKLLTSDLT